ncbi:MAG: NADH-quinone oxidoreductase subunit A [Candidatus Krumholzibacteria bacterium]|jgi:NADH-quinone oxidoreductase subunit A|nr:NADH-quinone oxidoreductase subunit A [Candidatus Krumholzibacteria bacterium]MDP6668661.1 NADH-quinone oxidoreductase subunit A [Candidatus Krumholzibacteria bacterium]MDP6796272.1 NADH-quinone oxidoreductase subunit A [Candidatus Krumholzibacteria bacterium]MDP7021032.1 NADH-quinone oxidoreductase subunit A [Candidatus Krumholzibacteria bacterium]
MSLFAITDQYSSGSYVPILILLVLSLVFSLALVAASRFVGRRVIRSEKMGSYECGMDPQGDARNRFSVKFYLVAILFIIFDIEVIFLFPWAVRFGELGLFGLVEMAIFLLILLLGYFYILGSGALRWDGRSATEEVGK